LAESLRHICIIHKQQTAVRSGPQERTRTPHIEPTAPKTKPTPHNTSETQPSSSLATDQQHNPKAITMDPSTLQNVTPEQKQAIMAQAQAEANQQIMASMVENMTLQCFNKCVGAAVRYRC
jgi:hypothetical protein